MCYIYRILPNTFSNVICCRARVKIQLSEGRSLRRHQHSISSSMDRLRESGSKAGMNGSLWQQLIVSILVDNNIKFYIMLSRWDSPALMGTEEGVWECVWSWYRELYTVKMWWGTPINCYVLLGVFHGSYMSSLLTRRGSRQEHWYPFVPSMLGDKREIEASRRIHGFA